ncbi:MAG: hypothetical protein ACR2NB_03725 [Solirubrobacteraceae bacterium]
MSLPQAHYTSCRAGLSAGSGFQFAAASPALDAATLEELERLVMYEPPPDAPREPTPEEIARMPVRFSFRPLYGGGAAILRSAYVGLDYSGRYGNFFTHAVVVRDPAVDLAGLLPADLWDAPFWRRTPVAGTELQEAAVEPVAAPPSVAALREPGRAAWVPAVIDAVLGAADRRWRVVVLDTPEAGREWIDVAGRIVGRAAAFELGFSSYEPEPRRTDVDVAVAPPGTDHGFAAYELGSTVQLVDVAGAPPPGEPPSLLARVVADWIARGDVDALATFSRETLDRRFPQLIDTDHLGLAALIHAGRPELTTPADALAALRLVAAEGHGTMVPAELQWLVKAGGLDAATLVDLLRAPTSTAAAGVVRAVALAACLRQPGAAGRALDGRERLPVDITPEDRRALSAAIDGLPAEALAPALRFAAAVGAPDLPTLDAVPRRIAPAVARGDRDALTLAGKLAGAPARALLTELVALATRDPGSVTGFASLLRTPRARTELEVMMLQTTTFAQRFAVGRLWVHSTQADHDEVLGYLVEPARDDEEARAAAELVLGPDAPVSSADAVRLLTALDRHRPPVIVERAAALLERAALPPDEHDTALADLLVGRTPAAAAVRAAVAPHSDADVERWLERILPLATDLHVPEARRHELTRILVDRVAKLRAGGHLAAVIAAGPWLDEHLPKRIAPRLAEHDVATAAVVFDAVHVRQAKAPKLAVTLDDGLNGWEERHRELLRRRLSTRDAHRAFTDWEEHHPAPASLLGRLTSRLRRAPKEP